MCDCQFGYTFRVCKKHEEEAVMTKKRALKRFRVVVEYTADIEETDLEQEEYAWKDSLRTLIDPYVFKNQKFTIKEIK